MSRREVAMRSHEASFSVGISISGSITGIVTSAIVFTSERKRVSKEQIDRRGSDAEKEDLHDLQEAANSSSSKDSIDLSFRVPTGLPRCGYIGQGVRLKDLVWAAVVRKEGNMTSSIYLRRG